MSRSTPRPSYRPKVLTLFIAAFLAGGTAAVGVNRFIDVARDQSKPTVECEPIFVTLRQLAAGTPLTVWDVALKDWPKAAVPPSAMRPEDSFEGHSVKLPVREGQPLLRSHLQTSTASGSSGYGRSNELPEDAIAAIESVAAATTTNAVIEAPVVVGESAVAETSQVAERDVPRTAEPTLVEPTKGTDTQLSAFASQTEASPQPESKDGWPTSSEKTVGDSGLRTARFLVVPERIAVLADQLVAQPADPVASAKDTDILPPAPSSQSSQGGPSNVASRPRAAPQRKPAPRGSSSAVPPVRIEPDPEAKIPPELPAFKTVFPNMAAGIERIESGMNKFRKERFGSRRESEPSAE